MISQSTIVATLIILTFLNLVESASEHKKPDNICTRLTTCGSCIAWSPDCSWCKAPDYGFDERCDFQNNLNDTGCSDFISPQSVMNISKNDIPRNAENGADPVQLAPQKLNIKLRPNTTFEFQMVFRQAENYPVDIYFIMDVSHTMKPYKETLASLSHTLVTEIRNITSNFRLGFGSFVDKTTLPYISTTPDHVTIPCGGCIPPYGFRNQLSLTDNETEFKHRVESLKFSGNLDAPEGGFDAIMQAVVCTKEIGWRDHSRKLILFSTDGSFHYAGDGKLGGIVIPNDGNCHMNEGLYSESENQDYPSISQLSQKVSGNKINVIFIVPHKQVDLYSRLSPFILGSNVGALRDDYSNVIELVRDNYNRIRSAIELKTEAIDDIEISFKVKCPDNRIYDVPKCEGLGIGQLITFNVTIQVKSCPSHPSLWNKTFQIYPVGLTEKLVVDLKMMCECPCEQPPHEEIDSAKCNSSGTYECGICTCNNGFYGKYCQCGGSSSQDDFQHDTACRMPNTSEACMGRGRCECGECKCGPISASDPGKLYTGRYCECSHYSCNFYQGQICGGSKRGYCSCGDCKCHPGYSGSSCNCLTNNDTCMAKTGELCNGKGSCHCGVCTCTDQSFKGPACEDCPTCLGKCDQNRDCVLCHLRQKDDPCRANCLKMELVRDFSGLESNDKWKACRFRDDDSCDIQFIYNYDTNEVKIKRTKECVARLENHWIILIAILAVIVVGIVCLFIWKLIVMVHDHNEYQAFKDEQNKAQWDLAENPIFKKATTVFANPTFKPTQPGGAGSTQ